MNNTDLLKAEPDHSKFWQNSHQYFDRVYQTMNLDPLSHRVAFVAEAGAGGLVSGENG